MALIALCLAAFGSSTLPPLLTVVHPSRAERHEGNRWGRRFSNLFALVSLGLAPVLLWFDWARHDGVLVLATIVAINCALLAGRLLSLKPGVCLGGKIASATSRAVGGTGRRLTRRRTTADRMNATSG